MREWGKYDWKVESWWWAVLFSFCRFPLQPKVVDSLKCNYWCVRRPSWNQSWLAFQLTIFVEYAGSLHRRIDSKRNFRYSWLPLADLTYQPNIPKHDRPEIGNGWNKDDRSRVVELYGTLHIGCNSEFYFILFLRSKLYEAWRTNDNVTTSLINFSNWAYVIQILVVVTTGT